MQRRSFIGGVVASAVVLRTAPSSAQGDPLPSWNDGLAKQSIVDFVTRTTTTGSGDWVPVPERIATFDNDGTLWTEQPMYFQTAFAFDRVKALAASHPEWRTTEPFRSILADDRDQLARLHPEAHAAQRRHLRFGPVDLRHRLQLQHRLVHDAGTTTRWPALRPEPLTSTSPSASSNRPTLTGTRRCTAAASTTSTA